jgi:hypothetical protein
MTLVLISALVAVSITYPLLVFRALERKDKRHVEQIDRLLLWRHDPKTAALPESTGSVLYLAPEDDEAWNKAHRTGEAEGRPEHRP